MVASLFLFFACFRTQTVRALIFCVNAQCVGFFFFCKDTILSQSLSRQTITWECHRDDDNGERDFFRVLAFFLLLFFILNVVRRGKKRRTKK